MEIYGKFQNDNKDNFVKMVKQIIVLVYISLDESISNTYSNDKC